ncbi:MAG: sodium:alanine symporter family protein [Ruminococcus sp.]|nr:sodium:alanine symporter family protein [Ruminococcus sp.]
MLSAISNFINSADEFLWGWFMIILLLGTHLLITIRTRFVQRKTFKAIKLSITKDSESSGDISPFQSLATALASTIGTGNIIGVGTAIALGGAGAVFWCWITGVLGIATKYAESLLAVKYRVRSKDGRMLGGAMYVLERGLKLKWLGILFAVFALLASFGIGSGVQVNAISEIMNNQFNADSSLDIVLFGHEVSLVSIIVGVVIAAVTAVVIFGGIKSISKVCELLVPAMAALYVLGCIIILVMNYNYILPAAQLILQSAFTPQSAAAGFAGSGIMIAARHGVARGLFSNESGMGSAPIVASAAQTRNSVRQALISSTGTFWDTVVVCLITGLVLVSSMLRYPADFTRVSSGQLSYIAFSKIPYAGTFILVVGIVAFAYSTVLGWSYYGERCVEYLFGTKGMVPYKLVFIFVLLMAPVISLGTVWSLANIANALMAIPNLIAVLLLSGVVVKETKYYLYGNRLDEFDKAPIPKTDK